MGGNNKKQKSVVTVQTPPASEEELAARKSAQQINDLGMTEAGYQRKQGAIDTPEARAAYLEAYPEVGPAGFDPFQHYKEFGQGQGRQWTSMGPVGDWEKRPLTADEQVSADRNKQIEDMIYKKLTGQISPEDKALVDEAYGSARQVGVSDMNAEFSRALDQLNIGEGRMYEDINQQARGAAASRGLNMTDSPISSEREKILTRFGEDQSRNKRMLGEDFGRNLRNFETSLSGAQAGATLDVGQRQQIFAESLRQFQEGLKQQAFANRQMIGESFANTALGLGNLRSRNVQQTSTGSASGGTASSVSSLMGGAGSLLQGVGSLFGSSGSSGASSAGGSVISSITDLFSSRDYKENIEPVDLDKLLEELESTPIYEWSYKGESRRHIGPVTEEAPKIMVDGKMLVPIDYLGFLFGALKALNEKVKRLENV